MATAERDQELRDAGGFSYRDGVTGHDTLTTAHLVRAMRSGEYEEAILELEKTGTPQADFEAGVLRSLFLFHRGPVTDLPNAVDAIRMAADRAETDNVPVSPGALRATLDVMEQASIGAMNGMPSDGISYREIERDVFAAAAKIFKQAGKSCEAQLEAAAD